MALGWGSCSSLPQRNCRSHTWGAHLVKHQHSHYLTVTGLGWMCANVLKSEPLWTVIPDYVTTKTLWNKLIQIFLKSQPTPNHPALQYAQSMQSNTYFLVSKFLSRSWLSILYQLLSCLIIAWQEENKFPLMPMGVLSTGSVHARSSPPLRGPQIFWGLIRFFWGCKS